MAKSPEAKARQAEYIRLYKLGHQAVGKRVNVTLSDEEYQRLQDAAKEYGEAPTAHLRRLAFAALDSRRVVSGEEEERLAELVRVVRGIANNLNQMARYSHAVRGLLDEREVGYNLQYLEETFRRFFEGGGGKTP
jgi:hypothetical protein